MLRVARCCRAPTSRAARHALSCLSMVAEQSPLAEPRIHNPPLVLSLPSTAPPGDPTLAIGKSMCATPLPPPIPTRCPPPAQSPASTGIVCDGEQPLVLSCSNGLVINVTAAAYGRALSNLCPGPGGLCPAANITMALGGQCNGRTDCSATPSGGVDPCPGINKYLQVSYACAVRPMCPGATYLAGLACVPCQANCAACSASGCSACSAGFVPYQGGCGEPAGG
jgi:hypothetical protein